MTDPVHDTLKHRFGFDAFRPGQEAVVRDAIKGRDLLAIMPTGGGKSLCFQLPALLREGVTLVVSPLIALMQDQVRLLDGMGIPATFLNSSLDAGESSRRQQALLDGKLRLLYVAPERLMLPEFLDGFLVRIKERVGLSALVVDEAHCVSEWGHDFRPEYRQLASVRERLGDLPCWSFTATATERVRRDIVAQLGLRDAAIHVASFNRPNLYYAVRHKDRHSYRELLEQARSGGSGIVYCLSRKRVDELAGKLREDGIDALPYHAGLDAETRRAHQDRYIRDDVQVMVATIAFGMGINKPDVRWVIHYDLPRTIEGYYQEAGRAGRDGEPARCTLYFGVGDIRTAEFLIQQKVHPETGEPLEDEQRIARQQLRQVLDYAEAGACRRSIQLRYFGESFTPPCGACDNCCEPRRRVDRTLEARQLLSCIARLAQRNQRFGGGYVIDILRGADTEKIRRNGHQALSTYGIGRQRPQDEWRAVLRALLHQGLVDETQDGYPVLRLNADSRAVLRGERRVEVAETAPRPAPGRKSRRSEAAAAVMPADEALFLALRELRKRLATEAGVPPYVVFNDASLRAMAELRPATLDAFTRIPGVGDRKLAQYGAVFTEVIRAHAGD
jgi:ATP-dependent DNA helicase RecQ